MLSRGRLHADVWAMRQMPCIKWSLHADMVYLCFVQIQVKDKVHDMQIF